MDEAPATPSTTTSSAAAVADSASTAASTKLSSNAAAVNTTASTTTTSVKLLIKASNQQFADQIVESDLLWTVKRLKTHLSCVYPSKPPVSEQKLIYSGQLLADALLLKDVIRSYKDVYTHNHIIHLVYTPKHGLIANSAQKAKASVTGATMGTTNADNSNARSGSNGIGGNNGNNPTPNTLADGLRQRFAPAATSPQQQQQQAVHFQPTNPHFNIPQVVAAAGHLAQCSSAPPFGYASQWPQMQTLATQQAAMYQWMQQVYAQYMDQCMRLSNTGANTGATGGAALPPNLFPHLNMPFEPPNASDFGLGVGVGSEAAGGAGSAINPVIQLPNAAAVGVATFVEQPLLQATAEAQTPAPPAGTAQQQQELQQPQPPQQQQVVAPRFPNIVQDDQDNRDWLDSFLSIMRLAVFLTLLYFNSSPLRCLIVVIIAGIIYLYHIGAIRVRPEHNNNNINRDNNQIRQGVQQVQQAQAAQQQQPQADNPPNADALPATREDDIGDEVDAATAAADTATNTGADGDTVGATADADNSSTSAISFVRTFVITFFTSLLPETPAL